jgi:hypothetical protein
MKIWIVSTSDKQCYQLLKDSFATLVNSNDERISEFACLSELEAIQTLRPIFASGFDNLEEIALIVDGNQTDFLSSLHQVYIL